VVAVVDGVVVAGGVVTEALSTRPDAGTVPQPVDPNPVPKTPEPKTKAKSTRCKARSMSGMGSRRVLGVRRVRCCI
jgi:hypothetical protein